MDRAKTIARLTGCYTAIPTFFPDSDLELNLTAMRRHVKFMVEGGLRNGNGVLLVCGAAGDFTVLSVEERLRIAEAVLDEVNGRIGIIVGAQSTNLRETAAIARGAAKLGALALQISPPFYHNHSEQDVYEFMQAASEAADIGTVLYTTYWQGKTSIDLVSRLVELPNLVGLKWAAPNLIELEKGYHLFAKRCCMIDNNFPYVFSHLLGARGINTHPTNYWPEWGVRLWSLLEGSEYRKAQDECSRVLFPYYDLACEVDRYTGGEGHLDRLCLELVGFDSSRSRPPMRDIRPAFRDKARKMLVEAGVPRVK